MKKFIFGTIFTVFALALVVVPAFAAGGFDQYGYNDTARVFNGTGSSWCLAGGQAADCLGIYSPDKLVMKWNAQWDNCNANGYDDPTYCLGAWTNNEWNGVNGGSGQIWHYKIIWVGSAGEDSPYWLPGGYLVWGNYEVVMDQGIDKNVTYPGCSVNDGGHQFCALAIPNGYGAVFSH